MSESNAPKNPSLNKEEIKKEDFIPSKWVNLFKIIVTSNVSRIAFGDAIIGKDGIFHTAITLSTSDLAALGEVIKETLAATQKSTEEALKAESKINE